MKEYIKKCNSASKAIQSKGFIYLGYDFKKNKFVCFKDGYHYGDNPILLNQSL